MGKDEETDLKKSELLDDILQETEELIKIFVTSIKTAYAPEGWKEPKIVFEYSYWFFYSILE